MEELKNNEEVQENNQETTEETPKMLTYEEAMKLAEETANKKAQSEADKVRTELYKKMKSIEIEKEQLLKEKMSEEEKAKYELNKLTEELRSKERDLLVRELTIKTIDTLREKQIPLEFKDFLIKDSEEATISNIEAFKQIWDTAKQKAVETTFKENSRIPQKSAPKSELSMIEEKLNNAKSLEEKIKLKRELTKIQLEKTK